MKPINTLGDQPTLAAQDDSLYYDFEPGTRIGPHTVRRRIGVGGMGEVYEVDHDALDTPRALKVVARNLSEDPTALRAFNQEVRLMRSLRHPNVVAVEDAGVDGPYHWLRMELMQSVRYAGVEVRSLEDYMRANQARGKTLPQGVIFAMLENVADAVAQAHARRLVHRDLKPANILLTHCGDRSAHEAVMDVRVADFGMVKVAGEEWVLRQSRCSMARSISLGDLPTRQQSSQFERDGALMGTYEYMSPEQKACRSVGPPTDVYSMGLLAYHALIGAEPSPEPPSALRPDLAAGWDALLECALDNDDHRRYRDGAAFRLALDEIGGQLARSGLIDAEVG